MPELDSNEIELLGSLHLASRCFRSNFDRSKRIDSDRSRDKKKERDPYHDDSQIGADRVSTCGAAWFMRRGILYWTTAVLEVVGHVAGDSGEGLYSRGREAR